MPKVYIALASYQGDAFIGEQLDSLQAQTYPHWKLLVRDDGSTDRTLGIVADYAACDTRIRQLNDHEGRLGAAGSFLALARVAYDEGADYLLFCDQDDVWVDDKVARQLAHIREAEGRYSSEMPLLSYCDLKVVDADLTEIAPSYMGYQRIAHPISEPLVTLLVQNTVTGCACIVNRALLSAALRAPGRIVMHDWWFALLAAATGRLEFDPWPGLMYRQHASNQVGAKAAGVGAVIAGKAFTARRNANRQAWLQTTEQARTLLEKLELESDERGTRALETIRAFLSIDSSSKLQRLHLLLRFRFRRSRVLYTAMMWARLLAAPRSPKEHV